MSYIVTALAIGWFVTDCWMRKRIILAIDLKPLEKFLSLFFILLHKLFVLLGSSSFGLSL